MIIHSLIGALGFAWSIIAAAQTDSPIGSTGLKVSPGLPSIRIVSVDSEPWAWIDEHGQLQGNSIDSIQQLITRAAPGRTITHTLAPIERVTHLLLSGEADIAYNIIDPRLVKSAINLGSIGNLKLEAWSLKREDPLSLESISQARVGIAIRLLKNYPFIAESQLVQLSRPNRLFHMMLAERIDAVVEMETLMNYFAAKAGKDRSDFDILLIDEIPAYIWMSKKSPLASQQAHWKTTAETIDAKQIFIDAQKKINDLARRKFFSKQSSPQATPATH